jgi:hypothetical protein
MSKSKKELSKYLGYKFYKLNDDNSYKLIRLIRIYEFNDKVLIKNLETGSKVAIPVAELKEYTPLEPYGFVSFAKVFINTKDNEKTHDVVVSLYRLLDIKMDMNEPYAICRQSITDFFYTIYAGDPNTVGVSATKEDCPTNIPYYMLAACDGLDKYQIVNYYLDDVVDTVLECLDTKEYDVVLENLLHEHLVAIGKPLYKPDSDRGWCKDLATLLKENNFITDMDELRSITGLDFDLKDYLVKKTVANKEVDALNDEVLEFFDKIFKVNAIDTVVIKYGVDIDLAEFNNTNYTLLRDNTNTLYVVVYKSEGEYLEKDLEDSANKQDVTTKLRLAFYNKYAGK